MHGLGRSHGHTQQGSCVPHSPPGPPIPMPMPGGPPIIPGGPPIMPGGPIPGRGGPKLGGGIPATHGERGARVRSEPCGGCDWLGPGRSTHPARTMATGVGQWVGRCAVHAATSVSDHFPIFRFFWRWWWWCDICWRCLCIASVTAYCGGALLLLPVLGLCRVRCCCCHCYSFRGRWGRCVA